MPDEYGSRNSLGARRAAMSLWSMPQMSANTLKNLGTLLMAFYFFSASVVQYGVLRVSGRTTDELNALLAADGRMMLWAGIGSVASVAGILAVPIFAWLLVQGAEHASSLRRYALRILVFALLSEIPYDLALTGRPFHWAEQNSLFTLLIALGMLWLMRTFQGSGLVPLVLNILFAAGGCFWAILLRCKFGGGFILLVAILYQLRRHKTASYWLAALVSLLYAAAPLGLVPIALCSGRREPMSRRAKLGYYAFYPIMLLAFAAWAALMRQPLA